MKPHPLNCASRQPSPADEPLTTVGEIVMYASLAAYFAGVVALGIFAQMLD
jgi:hypothetical protein